MKNLLFVTYSIACFIAVGSQTLSNVKTLYTDLFANYKKEVIPTDPTTPLVVNTTFYLNSIHSLNEIEESITMTGSFSVVWTDQSLTWNPASYGYLYVIVIDTKDMWTPPLFISNRVDALEPLGSDTRFFSTLLYDGKVYHSPGDLFEVKCSIDISKFPYDTQECTMPVFTWGIPSDFLILNDITRAINFDYYIPNSDWTLEESKTYVNTWNHYSAFNVEIKLRRQPLYYSVMVVLPTLLFAILNPLVFVLPVDSGERIGLAMTILLSYAIFLTLVSASIPASSNPMCVLLIIMIVTITTSGLIAIVTILISRYYHMENVENVCACLKQLTRWRLKRFQHKVEAFDIKNEKELSISGKDIADVLDFFCLIGSYVSLAIITVGYFIYVIS